MAQSDFIPLCELARLTGRKLKTLQCDFSAGKGPFNKILTKLGGKVGCWRADYEAFVRQNRKLSDAA